MAEPSLAVEITLPFAWKPGGLSSAMSHGSLLLLRVVNLTDIHEPEADRTQERIEARLDLMLHWLGMQLFGDDETAAKMAIRLEADKIGWLGARPDHDDIVLSLHIHPAITAPLRLAGRVIDCREGRVTAQLTFADPDLADAWTSWLFRQHRRAVHEARSRAD